MRRLLAATLVLAVAGCGIPRLGRAPGSDVVHRAGSRPNVALTGRACGGADGRTVTSGTVGPDGVSVGTCRSASGDTVPDASLDGRTPRPPVP